MPWGPCEENVSRATYLSLSPFLLPVHTFPLGDICPLGSLSGSHLCVFLTGEFRVLNHKIQLALYSTPMRKAWLLTDLNCSYFIFSSASYFVAGSLRPPRRRERLLWVRMWSCISAGCMTSNESWASWILSFARWILDIVIGLRMYQRYDYKKPDYHNKTHLFVAIMVSCWNENGFKCLAPDSGETLKHYALLR